MSLEPLKLPALNGPNVRRNVLLTLGTASCALVTLIGTLMASHAIGVSPAAGFSCLGIGVSLGAATFILSRYIELQKENPDDILSLGNQIKTYYNKVRLRVLPGLLKHSIIVGVILSVIGLLGFVTAISGAKIPHLEFLISHMPISIVLSLIMIRAGIHTINNGVMQSRRLCRWRQEGKTAYMVAWLEQDVAKKAEQAVANEKDPTKQAELQAHLKTLQQKARDLAAEAATFHYSLPEEWSLDKRLDEGTIYGKELADIPLGFRDVPVAGDSSISNRWFDWWLKQQRKLGVADLVLSQLMLLAGFAALIFMATGSAHGATAPINILRNDPYLSLSFSLLLFAYSMDCAKRGFRLLQLEKREKNRAEVERDFQLIAIAKKLGPSHSYVAHLREKFVPNVIESKPKKEPSTFMDKLHAYGKKILPRLGWPSVVIGGLITALGIAYLAMSLSNNIPVQLDFLTQNTPLSALFAVGLITTGFFALYRGISSFDTKDKKKVKKLSKQYRIDLLNRYFHGIPSPAILLEKPIPPELKGRISFLKGIAWPGFLLGAFLTFSSIVGLVAAGGVHISPLLDFVTRDPSYSAFFCLSLLGFGLDGISNADRMRSYHTRKEDNHQELETLHRLLTQS